MSKYAYISNDKTLVLTLALDYLFIYQSFGIIKKLFIGYLLYATNCDVDKGYPRISAYPFLCLTKLLSNVKII